MAAKRTLLTQEQFDRLGLVGWTIDEVPREHWSKIPGLQRLQDTFAVMASGSVVNPGILNGINAVAGIDVLAHETRPMAKEPPGNAYHYVIQKTSDDRFPYILHGPFRSETIVEHWFDADQLDRYWSDGSGPIEPDYDSGLGRATHEE
jgi:hypothetical protein